MQNAKVRAADGGGVPFAFEISAGGGVSLILVPAEYRKGLIPAHLMPRPAAASPPSVPALRAVRKALADCPYP